MDANLDNPVTRSQAHNLTERRSYSSVGAMVWPDISFGERIDRHVFRPGSVTAVIYQGVILFSYHCRNLVAMRPDALFMDNNARVHRTRMCIQFVEGKTLLQLE
ncbi:hypothetical protein TNCV_4162531 [Trichonephila clavipes]|nr:hypothetical protein TNCV_4162531 [Trichonephila clavipes]